MNEDAEPGWEPEWELADRDIQVPSDYDLDRQWGQLFEAFRWPLH